jgi:hypothetical protein
MSAHRKTESEKLSKTRCAICDFRMASRRFCNNRDSFPICNACTEFDFGIALFDLDAAYRDTEVYPNDIAVMMIAELREQIDQAGGIHS